MNNRYAILLILSIVFNSCNTATKTTPEALDTEVNQEYYQLKIFTCKSTQQIESVDTYLSETYLPALKRAGIEKTGVFKPREELVDSLLHIYVLIPFSSFNKYVLLEEYLANDSVYLASGSDYLNAPYDAPPYERIQSILMKAFVEMPIMKTPTFETDRADRVYELRSYESPTDETYTSKVDMFNAGGEVALFEKLGFNAVFYGDVISGANMPNLMYMTTFQNKETRDSLWPVFGNSPEWNEMKSLPKYQNNVSHADILFLYPTSYSDY